MPCNLQATHFKRHSVSTINSALFFNGTVSQVRKGNPWIKMHPDFKQSDIYKTRKQQQCVSDITELTPANSFPISSDMGSSDIVASWFLKRHGPWVIWICHLMPFNHRKYHLKLYQSDIVFSHSYAAHCCSS